MRPVRAISLLLVLTVLLPLGASGEWRGVSAPGPVLGPDPLSAGERAAMEAELRVIRAELEQENLRWVAGETGMMRLAPEARAARVLDRPWPATRGGAGYRPLGYDRESGGIDWSRRGLVGGVRDQGDCAAGWAYAATAALESAFLVARGGEALPDFDLSEAHLLGCMADYGLSSDCDAGWMEDVLWFAREVGLPEGAGPGSPARGCPDPPAFTRSFRFAGSGSVCRKADPEAIKDALHNYGPLLTTMTVHGGFLAYAGGIYRAVGPRLGAHAVLIVGYDEAGGYFIAKNSWGEGWGMGGYFQIAFDAGCDFGDWTSWVRYDAAADGPFAAMSVGATEIETDSPVVFTDRSLPGGDGAVIGRWSWDFDGDGETDAEGPGPHEFNFRAAGNFSPRLVVEDEEGRVDTVVLRDALAVAFRGPLWTVDGEDGSLYGDGSPQHPFLYVQMGLDAAAPGDTVLLRPGVYRGPLNTELRVHVGSVLLMGGGAAGETVLDGEGERRLLSLAVDDFGAERIVFRAGHDEFRGGAVLSEYGAARFVDCVFEDCAVGREEAGKRGAGGAIWSRGWLELEACLLVGSSSTGTGGAIHAEGGVLRLLACDLTGNRADERGGAIAAAACSLSVAESTFRGNGAGERGGAVDLKNAGAKLGRCLFTRNRAETEGASPGGGAISASAGSRLELVSSVLAGNAAPLGGALLVDGANVFLRHLTVWGNEAADGGGAVAATGGALELTGCILWGNAAPAGAEILAPAAGVQRCLVAGGYPGVDVLDADPLFADAERGDFALSAGSPALGAGLVELAPHVDFYGAPRPQPIASAPDLGALESPLAGEATAAADGTAPALAFTGAFPNPFNPSTTISFALPMAAEVRLLVFLPTGRLVATVLEQRLPAGAHQVPWTAQDDEGQTLASGVFLLRLEVRYDDGRQETAISKATLVK